MANEETVPLLPCASIDDTVEFYGVLGFRTTYKQRKPNPYVTLQREDLKRVVLSADEAERAAPALETAADLALALR